MAPRAAIGHEVRMDLSRQQFLKLLVFVGTGGSLAAAAACSSASPLGGAGEAPGPVNSNGGTSGLPPSSSGSSGSSGTRGDASADADASDASDDAFDSGTDALAATTCDTNGGTASAISANHGHALTVPTGDFADGADHTYSIQGTATHDHEITLTAAQMTSIRGGDMVTVTSTLTFSHTHSVTVVCAP
jgi:hypothetical protein